MNRNFAKRPRESPAVRIATSFITERIDTGKFTPGSPLPTIARMARLAGVSYVSMWKAVAGLKKAGLLDVRPGQAVRVALPRRDGRNEPRDEYRPSAKAKWEFVRNRIERDIFNGVYPCGRLLPSIKELRTAYGVSYSVLRKALTSLADKKTIEPCVRGYAPAGLVPFRRARNRVVLIAPCSAKTERLVGFYSEDFLRCLEKECLHAGLLLQIIGYYPTESDVVYFDFAAGSTCGIVDSEEIFGYITHVPYRQCGWEDVVKRIAAFRKPVALLDNAGDSDTEAFLMRSRGTLRLFSMGVSPKAGFDMGRYLLSRGHARVAYLSPVHKASWSINRYMGLRSAFETAGFPDAVRPITRDFAGTLEQLSSLASLSRIEQVLAAYREVRKTIPLHMAISLDTLFHLGEGELAMSLTIGGLRKDCEPLFKTALADSSITAWVAANDIISILALQFLRRRRILCPADLSLVGFDDIRPAIENKLTSYSFNIPALVNAMLRFVLNRHVPRHVARERKIEVDGLIIERGTSDDAPYRTS